MGMETNKTPTATENAMTATFNALQPGDEIEIETRESKPRRVVVTARTQYGIAVTSGRVRPGHFEGGWMRDHGGAFGVQWNPTLQQSTRRVVALRIVRRAEQRN